jgi:hypothetical protein
VQLARGSTVLRQKSWSRTLLTQEAVHNKEFLLQHYLGQFLVADGFTKQLSSSLFRRFKEGLNLGLLR